MNEWTISDIWTVTAPQSPAERLAQAVIARAACDFGLNKPVIRWAVPVWRAGKKIPHERIEIIFDALQAGQFLLTDTSDLTRLWFDTAGLAIIPARDRLRFSWGLLMEKLAMAQSDLRDARATWRALRKLRSLSRYHEAVVGG